MDHDRLFKELLTTFFLEFIDVFLPTVSDAIDHDISLVPMDKEIFTDVTLSQTHQVDILMKARFRGADAFFLIHIENQATAQADFPKRMFRYFARLTEKYDLPVYPVVIFSYDTPLRPEPDRFMVVFPGKQILRFDYSVIQLNRIPWIRFIRTQNPVAIALMAKMKMSKRDRPRVKAECMRLLASLKLDPTRTKLIGVFVDSYLPLNAREMKQYERAISDFTPAERNATMEIMTSWHREGIEEGISQGISQGKESLVLRLLHRRIGDVSPETTARLAKLSPEQLDDLGEALLEFSSVTELDKWLAQ